ncbi:MAG: SLC13 family permease [Ectothiorhodospiraceae bacterium]|nr:SLC13 family permease [Ectothiorhodospiraceae bacterium]MCH8505344.1 SLC13 family permease [Ectothiorhodospiraceae bacterium]
MSTDQFVILGILLATVAMFLWGRWRHDMVAVAALLACVLAGLIPAGEAFAGLGHPAVVTVACVLVLSHGLQASGAVDALTRRVMPSASGPTVTIGALTALAALLSGFMNNVGALALLMPVAIQVAARQNLPPGRVLMPLAFGSILGGMTTLIGTPPNLIVSGFRADTGAGTFAMFDFAPVGAVVALVGVVFVALIGWRLVPQRRQSESNGFETSAYLTEARVDEKAKAAGLTLQEIEAELDDDEAQVVGLIRNEVRLIAPHPSRKVRPGDILLVEAEPEALASLLSSLGLKLEEDVEQEDTSDQKQDADDAESADEPGTGDQREPRDKEESDEQAGPSDEVVLMEMAVLPGSALANRSATDVQLRTRFGVNLLAVSRQGSRSVSRLRTMALQEGDVLLMQGAPEALSAFASQFGCVPLAERALRIPDARKAWMSGGIMAAAVGGAAFGLVPAAVAFAGGVLATMALRVIPPRSIYEAVDWPVVLLLAALIPVAGAMEVTGAADLLAGGLLDSIAQGHAIAALVLLLVVTMFLSDLMNNAATAAVMCPIAISTATQLGVNPDAFLMAVAVGASCAFLTPIGHQNNTLILGPGGFRFGDYWRLGLPLELIVVAVSVPMLLIVWPL